MNKEIKTERYEGINGLKAYSMLGIVMMHVLANGKYKLHGFVFEEFIPSFAKLVFLFMLVSSFGMCCGYYQKIIDKKISVVEFYGKRYAKIWPYFSLLCVLDVVVSPSKEALFEVFANLTLVQGLLPNAAIEVIGVSWTLAVIFVFYLIFPFVCFLLENKKRAWLSFIVAVIYNFLCDIYFFDRNHVVGGFSAKTNILYCAVYFMAGGVIFLYRDKLSEFSKKYKTIVIVGWLVLIVGYFWGGDSVFMIVTFCAVALIYALGCKQGVLINPVVRFFGDISFEIYLCHMVIYRILEKMRLTHFFGDTLFSYIFTVIMTIIGASIFSLCVKSFLNKVRSNLKRKGVLKCD